jgi:F-type H+-transporting ATPase subunit epsilon
MANTFILDIVTPEKKVIDGAEVLAVRLPSVSGSFGVMAGHAPMLAGLGIGECVVQKGDSKNQTLVISGGFVEISAKKVTVLADTAEFAHDIDVDRAEAALVRAREMVGNVEGGEGKNEANLALQRAQTRLRIAKNG